MDPRTISKERALESSAVRDASVPDEAVLSYALVSLAAGMEQIERTLYNLIVRR